MLGIKALYSRILTPHAIRDWSLFRGRGLQNVVGGGGGGLVKVLPHTKMGAV